MIQFNELRIDRSKSRLIINAEVKPLSCYDNVYIDAIVIDNQDTYVENGPSTTPIYYKEISGNHKNLRIELGSELNSLLDDSIFFVYIITKGTAGSDCQGKQTCLGVTLDLYPIYQRLIYAMKEVQCDCKIPKNFIDDMLRFKAIELSIRTGHYTQAIKFFNKFFKKVKRYTKTCCNG